LRPRGGYFFALRRPPMSVSHIVWIIVVLLVVLLLLRLLGVF
jgi:hypothetical protein